MNKDHDARLRLLAGCISAALFIILAYFSPLSALACILILFLLLLKYRVNIIIPRIILFSCVLIPFVVFSYYYLYQDQIVKTYLEFFSSPSIYKFYSTSIISFFNDATLRDMFKFFLAPYINFLFLQFLFGFLFIKSFYRYDAKEDMENKQQGQKEITKPNFKLAKHDKKRKQVPLGIDLYNGKLVSINHDELRMHVCLIGATGRGKTVTLYRFLENALLFEKPIIYVDAKGDEDNIKKFRAICAKYNRNASVITLDGATKYNAFAVGSPTELTDKIMEMFDYSEEHYKLNGARFLQLVIRYMRMEGIECNLSSIIRYLDLQELAKYRQAKLAKTEPVQDNQPHDDEDENEAAIDPFLPAEPVQDHPPSDEGMDEAVEDGPDQLFDKIRRAYDKKSVSGLVGRLGSLAEGDLSQLFAPGPALVLADAVEQGHAILFSLDSLRYPAQSKNLGRLITLDIKTTISHHGKKASTPVSVLIDEFNVLASDAIVDAVNKGRSFGIEVLVSFQSLADIDKLPSGEALRRQILANCNTLIVMRVNDKTDAKELADHFGTVHDLENTVQIDYGTATGMGSLRAVDKYLSHPNNIKRLKTGEAYIKPSDSDSTKIRIAPEDEPRRISFLHRLWK